jgi:DHA1 family bicyclomycin/chloramphenicol resistance-like MFS transporter
VASTAGAEAPPPLWLLIGAAALGPSALNIFVPALPGLIAAFASDIATVNLALSLYLVTFAVAQLAYGPISDRYGRRPTLLCGIALFGVASLLCAGAASLGMLIGGRILQAIGGCAGMVVVRAMVRDSYERARAASVLASVTMAMAVAPAISQWVGGHLAERLGWRAGFVLLVVLGGGLLVAAWRGLPETLRERQPSLSIDALLASYRAVLRAPVFLGFAGYVALSSAGYFAFIAGAPFLVERVLGGTAADSGTGFLFVAAGYMLGSFVAARLSVRAGVERMVVAGTAIGLAACGALAVCALTGALGMVALFAPAVALLAGNGIALPSAIATAISVEPRAAGTAAGLVGCGQMAGGALATTLVAWLDDGSALPMIAVMSGSMVLSVLAYALARFGARAATARQPA